MTKAEISKNLRWKRPALMDLSYEQIQNKLWDISDACGDVHWAYDDDETLIDALDGNEDEAWEFKMMFTTLENEAQELQDCLTYWDTDNIEQEFDDTSVALIGNRYKLIGYDSYEEDYFSLTSYEANMGCSEASKRVMRKTKQEMLTSIGRTMGVILAFYNVELKYEYLKATIDILKERNNSILKQIKSIEIAYDEAQKEGNYSKADRRYDKLLQGLPDQFWIW